MSDVAPLELFVLKNESLEIHLVQFLNFLPFHQFHQILPLHLYYISMDTLTSCIAVECLARVLFNAVPPLWDAFLQVLQQRC